MAAEIPAHPPLLLLSITRIYTSRGEGRAGPYQLRAHTVTMVSAREEERGALSIHVSMLLMQEAVVRLPKEEKCWQAGGWDSGRAAW